MSEYFFKKGHKSYYRCKPISKKLFTEAFWAVVDREMDSKEAAKHVGISVPTFEKWFNMIALGETVPEELWKDEEVESE